jgi:hypothetical protein
LFKIDKIKVERRNSQDLKGFCRIKNRIQQKPNMNEVGINVGETVVKFRQVAVKTRCHVAFGGFVLKRLTH